MLWLDFKLIIIIQNKYNHWFKNYFIFDSHFIYNYYSLSNDKFSIKVAASSSIPKLLRYSIKEVYNLSSNVLKIGPLYSFVIR